MASSGGSSGGSTSPLVRPSAAEHAAYFAKYIGLVPEGDIAVTLRRQTEELAAFWDGFDEETALRGPAGKWTVKEVLNHVVDAERVFAYRALRIGRGDTVALPGFEQDGYVEAAGLARRSWASLRGEYAAVRAATLWLLETFPADAWGRVGTASGGPLTPLAAAYIAAGHELHHVAILRAEYL